MFSLFKTETEQKRDDYYKLYEKISDAARKLDTTISEIRATFNSYKGQAPNFSNSVIPSQYFDQSREEFTEELSRYIAKEEARRVSLSTAKQAAYDRYEYYKQQAVVEARIKKEKEEEKRKKNKNKK